MPLVKFIDEGKEIKVKRGETLLNAAIAADVGLVSECGGRGICKRCRVKVNGEEVLACQTRVERDIEVEVPEKSKPKILKILEKGYEEYRVELNPIVKSFPLQLKAPNLEDNLADTERVRRALGRQVKFPLDTLRCLASELRKKNWNPDISLFEDEVIALKNVDYGIALDVGTTTVVASLVDLKSGKTVKTASSINKQISCGEDILSRIMYSEENGEEGIKTLQRLIIENTNSLISEFEVDRKRVGCMAIGGNTTMGHLFLGLDSKYIRYEPYIPTANDPGIHRAKDLGVDILPNSPLFFLPNRAGYFGGDVVGDILTSDMHRREEISMLIDTGTNGEIVLGNRDWLACCACSAGPAFEGGEVACGVRAMRGAIERIKIGRDSKVRYKVIGDVKPIGICGSGLIDLMAELFINKLVGRRGEFITEADPERIREGEEGKEYIAVPREKSASGKDIFFSEADIKNLLRTKAAMYAATRTLLRNTGFMIDDVEKIYIAGGFGNYINIRNAIIIGLLPDIDVEKYIFIGNGSAQGAKLCLLSDGKRKESAEIAKKLAYIELSVANEFFDEFNSAMFIPHTDIELFPSVVI